MTGIFARVQMQEKTKWARMDREIFTEDEKYNRNEKAF